MKNLNKSIAKIIEVLALSIALAFCSLSGCTVSDNNVNDSSNGSSSSISDVNDPVKSVVSVDSAYIWGAPDTVSIMQNVDVLTQCEFWGEEWLENSDKLFCEGIKGDVEAFQVMITAKKDIKYFELTAGNLTREDGTETISKDNVEILAERYIETKKSSSRTINACEFLGWYPDALVPMQAYKTRRENKIVKDNNQGIWVNISIPVNAAAGTYKGAFKLTLDENSLDLPVTVKVYDITMPDEIHIKTAFDLWYEEIELGEESVDDDGNEIDWPQIYYDFMLSKRITPQTTEYTRTVYPTSGKYSQFVKEMVGIARDDRITAFRMPYAGATIEPYGIVVDKNVMIGLLHAMAQKNIELRSENPNDDVDLFKKAVFYFNSLVDEPSASKFEAVRYCDRAVTEAKNEVAPLLAAYPDLVESLMKIPHLVTSKVDYLEGDEQSGGVQTWCPQTQQYTENVLKDIRARKESTEKYSIGEGFWIYMTMESNNPFPSLQLDDNLLSPRSLFWMNKYYDIDGVLYWCACYYSHINSAKIKSKRDIWNDPNSYVNTNGDGYLLYPGSKYGLNTPISTLRLESLRQGTEDYEYIYLLENAVKEYNATHGKSHDFDKIMVRFYSDVFMLGSTTCRANIGNFMTARSELLTLLDAVSNDTENAETLLSTYERYGA
ncbi:MAG: DUF4091 domain-containing protein [Clostridia bacterium]|nr:DUF4091 domain-containing protein [Clostridia bacterium]